MEDFIRSGNISGMIPSTHVYTCNHAGTYMDVHLAYTCGGHCRNTFQMMRPAESAIVYSCAPLLVVICKCNNAIAIIKSMVRREINLEMCGCYHLA